MPDDSIRNAGLLRHELTARNASYALLEHLPHAISYGEIPVVVYRQSDCGRYHGNFFSASYRAILKRPQRHLRLEKSPVREITSCPKRIGFGANWIPR
jgi:hypothetical protein